MGGASELQVPRVLELDYEHASWQYSEDMCDLVVCGLRVAGRTDGEQSTVFRAALSGGVESSSVDVVLTIAVHNSEDQAASAKSVEGGGVLLWGPWVTPLPSTRL